MSRRKREPAPTPLERPWRDPGETAASVCRNRIPEPHATVPAESAPRVCPRQIELGRRLGWRRLFDPSRPAGLRYSLLLSDPDDCAVALKLTKARRRAVPTSVASDRGDLSLLMLPSCSHLPPADYFATHRPTVLAACVVHVWGETLR